MKLFIALLCTFLSSLIIAEDDIRSKVSDGDALAPSPLLIDPNDSIFGHKIGITEDQFFKDRGQPDGYLRLDSENTAAIYDGNTAFIFTNERLTGIRLTHSIIDHQLLGHFSGRAFHVTSQDWKLDNGIKSEMSLPKISELLEGKLKKAGNHSSKYHQVYEDGASDVQLFFSRHTDKEGDSAYKLMGILVTTEEPLKKLPSKPQTPPSPNSPLQSPDKAP